MAEHQWGSGSLLLGIFVGMLGGACLLLVPGKMITLVSSVKELGRLQTVKMESADLTASQQVAAAGEAAKTSDVASAVVATTQDAGNSLNSHDAPVSSTVAGYGAATIPSEQTTTSTAKHQIEFSGPASSVSVTTSDSSDRHASPTTSTTTATKSSGLAESTSSSEMITRHASSTTAENRNAGLAGSMASSPTTSIQINSANRMKRPRRNIFSFICGHATPQSGTAYLYRNLTLRMAKSVVLSQTTQYSSGRYDWNLWILADAESLAALTPGFKQIEEVAAGSGNSSSVNITLLPIESLMQKYGEAVHLFRHCASANLFLHEVLPLDVEEIFILGADQLVVSDLAKVWDNAVEMGWDDSKLMASGEECVEPRSRCGWYAGGSKHKFFQNGMSSGTTMFSVKNMRRYRYSAWVLNAISRFPLLKLGDQDIFNRYAMENPHNVTLLQCHLNLRADSGCDVIAKPPVVMHGNRYLFFRYPSWKAVAQWVDDTFELLRANGTDRKAHV
eukprot:TRINITY_DN21634_c0_g1_i1.p1 TRINITY_DN21634_c0_g1~~TRINITY_DN21634_c0_g1_i1.p1  ORF type:complete len:504 (-),score=66.04 TRINITY_DN21634_c0_g1_i1:45-1556(-)